MNMKHTTQTIARAYGLTFDSPQPAAFFGSILQNSITAGILPVRVDDSGKRKRCFLNEEGFLRAGLILALKEIGVPIASMFALSEGFREMPLYNKSGAILAEDGFAYILANPLLRPDNLPIFLIVEKDKYTLSCNPAQRFTKSSAAILVNVSDLYERLSAHDFKNRCFVRDFEA